MNNYQVFAAAGEATREVESRMYVHNGLETGRSVAPPPLGAALCVLLLVQALV